MPRRKTIKDKKPEIEKDSEVKLVYPYPEDNSKQLLVWAGAIFFVLAIGFVWVMNTKRVFESSVPSEPVTSSSTADWSKLREELSMTMAQVKTEIAEIKNLGQTATSTATSTLPVAETAATTTTTTITLSPEQLQNLKDDLKKLDKDL